jgi:hypothetical protein
LVQLENDPDKLEDLITAGWKGLPGSKAQAYGSSFVGYEENEVL